MESQLARHIVCAVRGRPESRATVSHAIELALQTGAKLTFLHILDAEFLKHTVGGRLSVVYQELSSMGEFAMLILVDRALRKGVEEVDYVIREGNIQKMLYQFALETGADVFILGNPRTGSGKNIFATDEFNRFIAQLEADANLRVIRVERNI